MSQPTTQQKSKKIKKTTLKNDQTTLLAKSTKQDSRFAKASYDPKFMSASSKITKVKIDKRFSKMMKGPSFKNQSSIDRYGRSTDPSQTNKELANYYYMDEQDQPQQEEPVQIHEQKDDDENGLAKWMQNYDEESSQLSDIPIDFDEQDIDKVWDDDSQHVIKGENVEATNRLALCNYDWMNISSRDLMLLFSSFKTNSGYIKSIKVYMSNIGKEKLKEEEQFGPQGIWKQNVQEDEEFQRKPKDWKKSWKQLIQDRQEDDHAFDQKKLREYEKQRLRYFYAVIECDNKRTADQIYKECDGNQFENSNLPFDLRFIPNDLQFDPTNLKEQCNQLPVSGQVKNFITKALGHSKVSLSWEDPQLSLAASLKKKNWSRMSEKQLDQMDWSMYINQEEVQKQDGMKRIVNQNIKDEEIVSDWKKSYNKKNRKNDDDIQIAFQGGFDTSKKNKGKIAKQEEEQQPVSLKKQKRSMKQRRRQNQEEKKKRRQQLQLVVQDQKNIDFKINLNDQRFKAVYENPFYSIDPVDSRFDHRKSGKVFQEIVKRNKNKNRQ